MKSFKEYLDEISEYIPEPKTTIEVHRGYIVRNKLKNETYLIVSDPEDFKLAFLSRNSFYYKPSAFGGVVSSNGPSAIVLESSQWEILLRAGSMAP